MDFEVVKWLLASYAGFGAFVYYLFKYVHGISLDNTNKRLDRLERGQDKLFQDYRERHTSNDAEDDAGLE